MFPDASNDKAPEKGTLQQALKITYALSIHCPYLPLWNRICPFFFAVYTRSFPTMSVFGSHAFMFDCLVFEPYIVCSLVAGYSDDITQV